jgi:hypothetical protein
MAGKFQVQFLEDAAEFLDNLDEKAREKIYYNIKKPDFQTTRNYSKN